MNICYDADTSGFTSCTTRRYESKDINIGILLFSYGSDPNPFSVCLDGKRKILLQGEHMLQKQLEKLAESEQAQDLHCANTVVRKALEAVNSNIREARYFLGQSLYLGGAVFYTCQDRYILCSFGGASVSYWDGTTWTVLAREPEDRMIRNALGGSAYLQPEQWGGKLPPGTRLFASSGYFKNLDACIQAIREGEHDTGRINAVASLLRNRLSADGVPLTAIMDICTN